MAAQLKMMKFVNVLAVSLPPSDIGPEKYTKVYRQGDTVNLNCAASGSPYPQLVINIKCTLIKV